MQARLKSPAVVIPDAMTAIRSLNEAVQQGGVPQYSKGVCRSARSI